MSCMHCQDRAHHTADGFRNRYPHGQPTSKDFWKWWWSRRVNRLPKPPRAPILPVPPDLAFIRANRTEIAVTWIGHSTVLLQGLDSKNILTDPVFSDRASPFAFIGPKRHQPPGITLADLPPIDIVLISHNHYDHLDYRSVKALYHQAGGPPEFYLPLGLDEWFKRKVTHGDATHLHAMDWWEEQQAGALAIYFLPVQHWSSRTPWDRNKTLWGAFAVQHPGFSFFFSGDLGYSRDVADIGECFGGFDLAAIAVGAYEPRSFMKNQHVNPEEAVQVHRDLRARRSFGIHHSTFALTDEPLDQPPADLARARREKGISEEEFFLLRHGETRRFSREALPD